MELRMESLNFGGDLILNGRSDVLGTLMFAILRDVATNSQSPRRRSSSLVVMDGVMASNREAADVNSSISSGRVMKIPVGLASTNDLVVVRSSFRRVTRFTVSLAPPTPDVFG